MLVGGEKPGCLSKLVDGPNCLWVLFGSSYSFGLCLNDSLHAMSSATSQESSESDETAFVSTKGVLLRVLKTGGFLLFI